MATVQDILDIVDHYIFDYGEYVYATFSGDASGTVFAMNSPLEYHSETITVGAAAKTRDVDYTVNLDNGEVTFTTAPAAGTNNVVIQATKKTYALSTKIEGIKNALGKYYYKAISTGLDMTESVTTVDISSLSALKVYAVEQADADGDYYGAELRRWFTNTDLSPTTLYLGGMPGDTLSLLIRYTKKFTRTLTTPASTVDANFPTEAYEVLALWAAVYCLQNQRIKRVVDVNLPAVINDFIAKPSDHRLLINDLIYMAKDKESEYYHLLKPPINRQVKV
jgi:flagellar hook protein FlgE